MKAELSERKMKRIEVYEHERRGRLGEDYFGSHPEIDYHKAFKLRLKAGQIGKAIKNYEAIARIYGEYLQGARKDIEIGQVDRERERSSSLVSDEARYCMLKEKAERNLERLKKVKSGKWFGLTGRSR